jgi:hypothetical protein
MSTDKTLIGHRVAAAVALRLREHCAARGYIKSVFVERAITKALDEDGAAKKPPTEEES